MLTIFVLAVSISLGIVLSYIITMVLMYWLLNNPKVIDWMVTHYMKMISKVDEYFENK